MTYIKQGNRFGGKKSFGSKRNFGDRDQDRKMHPAVCAKCGQDCMVPFFPDGSKPVYCSNCFEKQQDGGGFRRNNFGKKPAFDRDSRGGGQDLNKELLVSINAKLGKILELMTKSDLPAAMEPKKVKSVEKSKKTKKKASKSN